MNRIGGTVIALLCLAYLAVPISPAQTTSSLPPFGHVLIVVGENAGFSTTYHSGAMPYLDSLADSYGLATNYYGDTHPSIGNYMVLATGQVLTNDDTQTPSTFPVSADNLALALQNAGKTWKDYVENLPSAPGCGGLKGGNYYSRHDPLEYMTTINSEAADYVCFSQFSSDLANNALPNLAWLAPNGTDDGHDTSATDFDNWLKAEIPAVLASSYFGPGGDGLLVITFDEDENTGNNCGTTTGTGCGGQVETVVISPYSKLGYQSTTAYEHENVLRTLAEGLGVDASGLGAAASAAPMADFFNLSGSVTLTPGSLSFASQVVGTSSPSESLTLTNGTTSAVDISSLAISGTDSTSFSQTNTCGASLSAGSNCSINVTFTPGSAGALAATLTVTDSSGSPQIASLSGIGTAASPIASLAPSSLTFPATAMATTSAAQTVKLSNTGNAPLTIASIGTAVPFAQTNNCGSALAEATSCTITVTFTPPTAGPFSGALLIADNAGGSPQSVSLSGTGTTVSGAQDYYVAVNGSDATGNGTLTNPWATILYASAQIGPGAKVHVAPGTYTVSPSSLVTNASGTSRAPVTYVSDAAYAAKVVSPAWDSDLGESVWVNTGNYVVIKGFDISGDAYQGISNSGMHVLIQGNDVHNIVPKDCNSYGGAGIDDYGNYSDDVGNIVADVGNFGLGACGYVHGIYANRTGGHIWNNIIYHIWSFGIQVWGAGPQGITISGNTIFNNGISGLVIGAETTAASNMLVTDNIFIYNKDYGFEEEGTTGSNRYLNNLAYGNGTADFNLQTGTASGTITGKDPLLANYQPDGGDQHLTAASPAINAGTSQGAPSYDFAGNARPQARSSGTGWDIGAYEYTGTLGSLTLSPNSLTFSPQLKGASAAPQSLTLTNGSGSAVTIGSIGVAGANPGDFAVAGADTTCAAGSAIPVNGSCTIAIKFTPAATGARSATIDISDSAPGSPQTVALSGTGTDFSIGPAARASTSATISAGQTASYDLAVSPVSGFTGSVTLSCSGAPAEAACSVNPSGVTVSGNSSSNFTVQVTTTARGFSPFGGPADRLLLELFGVIMGLVLALMMRSRTDLKRRVVALPAIGLFLSVCLSGCAMTVSGSGGGGSGGGGGGTPSGTYTIVINAQSQGVARDLALSLTVE